MVSCGIPSSFIVTQLLHNFKLFYGRYNSPNTSIIEQTRITTRYFSVRGEMARSVKYSVCVCLSLCFSLALFASRSHSTSSDTLLCRVCSSSSSLTVVSHQPHRKKARLTQSPHFSLMGFWRTLFCFDCFVAEVGPRTKTRVFSAELRPGQTAWAFLSRPQSSLTCTMRDFPINCVPLNVREPKHRLTIVLAL